jgi:hypothetical protein
MGAAASVSDATLVPHDASTAMEDMAEICYEARSNQAEESLLTEATAVLRLLFPDALRVVVRPPVSEDEDDAAKVVLVQVSTCVFAYLARQSSVREQTCCIRLSHTDGSTENGNGRPSYY